MYQVRLYFSTILLIPCESPVDSAINQSTVTVSEIIILNVLCLVYSMQKQFFELSCTQLDTHTQTVSVCVHDNSKNNSLIHL